MEIYKITNLINNKCYIGKDSKSNPNYYGSGKIIKQAIEKYGKEHFVKEILDFADDLATLNEKEIYWIEKLNTIRPNGYNISKGGNGGDTFTNHPNKEQYTKNKSIGGKKMWQDEKYRENFLSKHIGKERTDEAKKNISEALKDKPKSDEHKKALSKAWEKRKIEHPVTEETKLKMHNSSKGKINIKEYKCTNPSGIEYFTTEGLVKFCENHNLTSTLMVKVANGERKHHKQWKCERL